MFKNRFKMNGADNYNEPNAPFLAVTGSAVWKAEPWSWVQESFYPFQPGSRTGFMKAGWRSYLMEEKAVMWTQPSETQEDLHRKPTWNKYL